MTKIERCKECGANLAMVGVRHRCVPRAAPPPVKPPKAAAKKKAAEAAKKAVKKPKVATSVVPKGRPRLGEERAAPPWIAAGMSRRTWFRRKAEGKQA